MRVVKAPKPWFVYIAECSDGSLYCGIARDVEARIAKHDAGKGARYTRGRGPLVVRAVKRCKTHRDALRLEIAVKKLTREAKTLLFDDRKRFQALARAITSPVRSKKDRRSSGSRSSSRGTRSRG